MHPVKWAEDNGVDLMCVTYQAPDFTISYELQGFDLTVRFNLSTVVP